MWLYPFPDKRRVRLTNVQAATVKLHKNFHRAICPSTIATLSCSLRHQLVDVNYLMKIPEEISFLVSGPGEESPLYWAFKIE